MKLKNKLKKNYINQLRLTYQKLWLGSWDQDNLIKNKNKKYKPN